MSDKPCCKCGINPRKVSSRGHKLTMCDECQRAQWRQYKPQPKPKTPKRHKAPKEPKPEQPKPEPKPKKQPAERIQSDLMKELIAARFELARLRRMIASASTIDEIRGQL